MRTHVALIVEIEHDGSLTPAEMAKTIGVWVEMVPDEARTIQTETEDKAKCVVKVVAARAASTVERD